MNFVSQLSVSKGTYACPFGPKEATIGYHSSVKAANSAISPSTNHSHPQDLVKVLPVFLNFKTIVTGIIGPGTMWAYHEGPQKTPSHLMAPELCGFWCHKPRYLPIHCSSWETWESSPLYPKAQGPWMFVPQSLISLELDLTVLGTGLSTLHNSKTVGASVLRTHKDTTLLSSP